MVSSWIRKKRILNVPKGHEWWVSHAQLPTALVLDEKHLRIFVAGRDTHNRGSIVRIDVDPSRDMKVLDVSSARLLQHGPAGAFDSDGVGVTSVAFDGGRHLFTSAGMNASAGLHYEISIGQLVSSDGGETFQRVIKDPVLSSGVENPAGCSSGQALLIDGVWHMWFVSWRGWDVKAGQVSEPLYDIRHAVSEDGLRWKQDEAAAIALVNGAEGGLARPWVQESAQGYEMWYSIRGRFDADNPASRRYRLGYATSSDALSWTRRDEAHDFLPAPVPGEWDSEMQCYASVVTVGGRSYMFYCGNDYGKFGFGYAQRA